MAQSFKVRTLLLSGQAITADASSVYLNGAAVGGATVANLQSTGQANYNLTIGGDTNLSGNLTQTGVTLRALTLGGDTNLSGNLTTSGVNLGTTIGSTGQQAWTAANANAVNLSGNAANTGASLIARDNSLSGLLFQRPMVVTFSTGPIVWTAQPNTGAFFNGSSAYCTQLDLVGFTGVRLVAAMGNTAAAASGALYLGYLGSFAVAASSYLAIDTTISRTRTAVTTTVVNSGWQPLAAGARSGVCVALLGSSGNGVLSPQFGNIMAQFM